MNAATQDLIHGDSSQTKPTAIGAGLSNIARVAQIIGQWNERSKQRRQLSDLTPRELQDIGISKYEVAVETAKPFWRA